LSEAVQNRGVSVRGGVPTWARELLAAITAVFGWLIWLLSIGVVLIFAISPLVILLPRSWWSAAAVVLGLIRVLAICAWPLIVLGWPRFARWTWVWGFVGSGAAAVLYVAAAVGLPVVHKMSVLLGQAVWPRIVGVGSVVTFVGLVVAWFASSRLRSGNR
jgi:hypothetical protein